ncbi:MAG: response regulator, partial [Desulfofustis sp.]|nr:response regulator [Desulfofustis sp.]
LYVPNSSQLASLLELNGKRIAVKQGDIHFKALKSMTENFNLRCRFLETDEYETVFEMLDHQYADVGVVNRLFGTRMASDYKVKATTVIFNPIEMRYGVAEGTHGEILAKIDSHLTAFKKDENSIYHKSINRWFVVDTDNRMLPDWLFYLLYTVAGSSFILFCISVLFRYQVKKRTTELTLANAQLQSQIEERRRAEEQLSKFARMAEASSDAMALVDTGHVHVLANSTYRKAFAGVGPDIVGKSVQELFGSDYFENELKALVAKCLQGETVRLQIRPKTKGAQQRHWYLTLSPFYSSNGEISGYVLDIRDVTQEVELQDRLKNAQKMEAIGLLAGGIAHDLNNILSGLVSYPDLLLVSRSPEDPITGPLQTIKKSGERAAAIVQDLLTLARRGVGLVTPLNWNHIIEEFLESPEYLDMMRDTGGIEMKLSLAPDLSNILGSAAHLSKILMNLLWNSIEAMSGGGMLLIATENKVLEREYIGYEVIPAGEYVLLSVIDTGIGVGEGVLDRIFEPFYTSKIMGMSGTGLGMAVVWGVVKDHDGYTDVVSKVDQGTTFSLYFPLTRESTPRAELMNISELNGSGQKILVVDDLAEQRHIASQILELLHYSVDLAASGEEAVEKCRRTNYDLVLLDMIMPGGIDGFATYQQLCLFNPGQKVVIASGYSDSEHVKKAQKLGAGAYIKKPYTVVN